MSLGIKRIMKILLAMAIVYVAAEALLIAVLPFEVVHGTWATPGIYTPQPKWGFMPTPNYRGVMYNPDKAFLVPLELDALGWRPPGKAVGSGPGRDILMLGGVSMAFSYGLPQEKALHARLAEHMRAPTRVSNYSFPGDELWRSFGMYCDQAKDLPAPDLVLLCIYGGCGASAGVYQPDDGAFVQKWEGSDNSIKFPLIDGFPFNPEVRPFSAKILGRYFAYSYLLPQLIENARSIGKQIDEFGTRLLDMDFKLAPLNPVEAAKAARAPSTMGATPWRDGDKWKVRDNAAWLHDFLQFVGHYFSARNAKVLVVLLPDVVHATTMYEPIIAAIPESMPYVDLQPELRPEIHDLSWCVAGGHYGAQYADAVARRLAVACEEVLRSPARAIPAPPAKNWAAKQETGVDGVFIRWGKGFHARQNEGGGPYRWAQADARFDLVNELDRPVRVRLSLRIMRPGAAGRLTITGPGFAQTLPAVSDSTEWAAEFEAPSGDGTIEFSFDGERMAAPNDPRIIYFGVCDFSLEPPQ